MAEPYSDDLDELLDSALDDFAKLDLTPCPSGSGVGIEEGKGNESAATSSLSSRSSVRGLGMGLPDLKAKKQGKKQVSISQKKSHATEALEKLTEQTREAVRELESVTAAAASAAGPKGAGGFDEEDMVEDFVKHFEELAGSQDMESIVETMMQQLLSKEILQEPMKEIGERYPKWLQDHKETLSKDEYDRYSHQYELMLKLNEVYEDDPNNFQKIVDLMQKMQECGQPPSDIVQDLAPGFDLNNLSQLPPEFLGSPSNCCVM